MRSLLIFILLLMSSYCYGQLKDSNGGALRGHVRDTVNNYSIKSASVSLHKAKDSVLVQYQSTNSFGDFYFKNLPLNTDMYLEISHLGYRLLRHSFKLTDSNKVIDLKNLILTSISTTLNEVTISNPKISLNGDTLEFNASAFKLDSNAVIEDLLREIPNVTLWGDGKVTINGREVKNFLVNGKPFFGNNPKIALQNISKNALEKVQVYNTVIDKTNPLDSILEVNLKLKKGRDHGYFGKIGFGYGTRKRVEADGNINIFSSKFQFSIVGAYNNVNKMANNISMLINNSSFKGVGTNIDYQPSFSTAGLARPITFGTSFTYDFLKAPSKDKQKKLYIDFFAQDIDLSNLQNTKTLTTINQSRILEDNINSEINSSTKKKQFNSRFETLKDGNSLKIYQSINQTKNQKLSTALRSTLNDSRILTSTNDSQNTTSADITSYNFKINYQRMQNSQKGGLLGQFKANYSFFISEEDSHDLNASSFKSYSSAYERVLSRQRKVDNKLLNQELGLEIANLRKLMLKSNRLAGFDIILRNDLSSKINVNKNLVEDFEINRNSFLNNQELSNNNTENILEVSPSISISQVMHKAISNRFSKLLSIQFVIGEKFIFQGNKSDHIFQDLRKAYKNFAPSANILYGYTEFGEYTNNYNLSYSTNVGIPLLQQLAPLVDSTNLYYIQKGNANLKETIRRSVRFSFSHESIKLKNTLNYNTIIEAGVVENNIADSILIDNDNKRTIFSVNTKGAKFINLSLNIKKAYKFGNGGIQFQYGSSFNYNTTPNYINSLFVNSQFSNFNNRLDINYTMNQKLSLEVIEQIINYRSNQNELNNYYKGMEIIHTASIAYNFTSKFSFSSNININQNSSSGVKTSHYTIWNTSMVCRFLKGNNAEFKISALDLLRQNKSIINYGGINSSTSGIQTVLRNYFIVSLAYYPRKF